MVLALQASAGTAFPAAAGPDDDPVAQLVRALLVSDADNAGRSGVDVAQLAARTGYAPSAVRKALRRLAAAALIEWTAADQITVRNCE
jgi:DNA-binding GntR family transcriptional regulator